MLELMSNDERELCINNKLATKPCPLPSLPPCPDWYYWCYWWDWKMSKLNQFLLEMTNCWSMTDWVGLRLLARPDENWKSRSSITGLDWDILFPWQHRPLLVVVWYQWFGRALPVVAGVVPLLSWRADEFNIQKLTREGGREGGCLSGIKNINILQFSCFISCFMFLLKSQL